MMTINNLHQLVENQTKKTPHAIALLYLDKEMTYAQLNEKSNQLAHYLYFKNLTPEEPIAICLERCFDLFVAILAVLKVGCAYVPLEPRHPPKRLQGVLEDCQARIVLTQSHLVSAFEGLAVDKIRLDVERDLLGTQKTENLDLVIAPDRLAYVIYTSGSTGRPKGVCIEHRNVCSFLRAFSNLFPVTEQDRALQFSSISFDMSVIEWGLALVNGAILCLLAASAKKTVLDTFFESAPQYKITVAFLTPGVLHHISPDFLPTLKTLIVGGEVCTEKVVSSWYNRVHLINAYGPTETTVLATAFSCDLHHPAATIGFPLDNTVIYILDDQMNLVLGSNEGEIYIAGQGVGRGYLNRPDLTEKHFIPNPFKAGERLYKTGDLACYLPDGAIKYMGRNDNQVKIRGYRVELQEIENIFLKLAPFQNVIVITDPNHKDKLIAFANPRLIELDGKEASLLQQATAFLPSYMLPDSLILLDRIPLNASGKYDKEILYQHYENGKKQTITNTSEGNHTHNEKKLIQICYNLLNYDGLYPESDLLSSGLDSIMILELVSQARRQGLSIQLKQIYQQRTIKGIAQVAEETDPNHLLHISTSISNHYFGLSPIQHWFFKYTILNPNHWNQAICLKIEDPYFDIAQLEQAYYNLPKYHQSLNLRFSKIENHWQQAYRQDGQSLAPFSLISINNQHAMKPFINAAHQEMNIAQGPLMRALLFKEKQSGIFYLYLIAHHLAIDGISWRILLEDLTNLYCSYLNNETLRLEQTMPYQTWISKIVAASKKLEIWNELDYWNEIAAKIKDDSSLQEKSTTGVNQLSTASFSLDPARTLALLQQINSVYGTKMDEILLSALALLFAEQLEKTNLFLMLDRHGREEIIADSFDFSRTVGWFTSLFLMYLQIESTEPQQLILAIKTQLAAIPNNGVGYGLLKYLTGNDSRTALLRKIEEPRLNFNYMGQLNLQINPTLPWQFLHLDFERGLDKPTEDLTILSYIHEEQLKLAWTYNLNCYSAETIETWGKAYLNGLERIIDHCLRRLDERQPYESPELLVV